jgi:hypothetical protein
MKKNKIDKDNSRKKTKYHKKKSCGGNTVAIYFMRKSTVVILNQLNIKNNKINKDNFEKNHNKKKKLVGEHYSNPYCFKGKNFEAKFSTSSI